MGSARLALLVGTTMLGADFPAGASRVEVRTERGEVALLDAGEFLVLQRHGLDGYRAPHAIDHGANLLALAELGVERLLAISSTGSLRAQIPVGSLVAPDDFIAPQLGLSLYEDGRGHLIPALDADWRQAVIAAWAEIAAEPLRDGGVYRQMPGPRFETPAEVRMLAEHADIVGMTLGSECVIACELGLPYAAICSVDNLANGIGERALTKEQFAAGVLQTRERLVPALLSLLSELSLCP